MSLLGGLGSGCGLRERRWDDVVSATARERGSRPAIQSVSQSACLPVGHYQSVSQIIGQSSQSVSQIITQSSQSVSHTSLSLTLISKSKRPCIRFPLIVPSKATKISSQKNRNAYSSINSSTALFSCLLFSQIWIVNQYFCVDYYTNNTKQIHQIISRWRWRRKSGSSFRPRSRGSSRRCRTASSSNPSKDSGGGGDDGFHRRKAQGSGGNNKTAVLI